MEGETPPFFMGDIMFEVNPNYELTVKKSWDRSKGTDKGYVWRKIFIIDNFYENPDAVRATARSYEPKYEKEYCGNLIGGRVVEDIPMNLKETFEALCRSNEWTNFEFDQKEFDDRWSKMKFMVNVTKGEDINKRFDEKGHAYTFHKDGINSKWAALVYLNKPEQCSGGTKFYSWEGHPHSTPREEVHVDMVYNRMVLYEANCMHGAVLERDTFTEHPRLTQVFFM